MGLGSKLEIVGVNLICCIGLKSILSFYFSENFLILPKPLAQIGTASFNFFSLKKLKIEWIAGLSSKKTKREGNIKGGFRKKTFIFAVDFETFGIFFI